MIVKSVLKEDLLTLAEVRDLLEDIRQKRASEATEAGIEEQELGYELRRAMRHADLFAKGTAEESRRLVDDLLKTEKITPEIAVKIADIRPQTKDELRALYAKERFTLSEEELDGILDIVFRV